MRVGLLAIGSLIALIAGKGTLLRGAIIWILILGSCGCVWSAVEHRWVSRAHKSRSALVVFLPWLVMGAFAWSAWPASQLVTMDFGFSNETTGEYNNVLNTIVPNYILGPPRHVGELKGIPLPTKPVSFKLVGRVTSKSPAKNAHVWVRICGECDWLKIPEGFTRPTYGPNTLIEIDKPLGDIPAGPIVVIGDFVIAMPVSSADTIEMGVGYTCDSCAPADSKQQEKLTIHAPLKQP